MVDLDPLYSNRKCILLDIRLDFVCFFVPCFQVYRIKKLNKRLFLPYLSLFRFPSLSRDESMHLFFHHQEFVKSISNELSKVCQQI